MVEATESAALAVHAEEPPLRIRAKLDPRLVMLAHPDSARAAAYRALCENLRERGAPRVVAVSSASPGEGKTSCALNLALAFAEERGLRTLLVDGNFFEPELARVFGLDRSMPESACLDLPWLDPYTLVELSPSLHIAVMQGDRPPPCFDASKFDQLIDLLSGAGYDRIVIDTPALDGSAAVRRVIAAADGVLLAARAGRTTTRALRRAAELVPKGMLLGAALVDADAD